MKLVGRYALSDLAILNFTAANLAEEAPDSYESVLLADCPSAPDTDGTTRGPSRNGWGWNCLVLREDVDAWVEAGVAAGYDVAEAPAECVKPGHYGDGHWAGVDLAADPRREGFVYWIDLEAMP